MAASKRKRHSCSSHCPGYYQVLNGDVAVEEVSCTGGTLLGKDVYEVERLIEKKIVKVSPCLSLFTMDDCLIILLFKLKGCSTLSCSLERLSKRRFNMGS